VINVQTLEYVQTADTFRGQMHIHLLLYVYYSVLFVVVVSFLPARFL
jgi:hypothetical protein